MDYVIVVDEQDEPLGRAEKMEAHREGILHRAFSVFLFDKFGRTLLQRRAMTKYHSPGLWSNACCSHPRPGEETEHAALRRLEEEMGIRGYELRHQFTIQYRVEFEDGLIEHELDHVFIGTFDGTPVPDPAEVMEWKWVDLTSLKKDVMEHPQDYTYWLKEILPRL